MRYLQADGISRYRTPQHRGRKGVHERSPRFEVSRKSGALNTYMKEVIIPRQSERLYPEHRDIRFEPVIIPAKDGIQMSAEVCASTSESTTSRGVIVFVHGFCGNKHENGLFRELALHSSAQGFDSVLYDWRGISKSEGDFRFSTLDEHVTDFEQVVEWTRERFPESSESLSAVGFSLGAAIVGLALNRSATLNRVAYISPAVRPRLSMWPRYNTEHIQREIAEHGFVQKPGSSVLLGRPILDSLRDTDLGPQAFDVEVPLLVCHGTKDTRIDSSHTRELVEARDRGQDFRYIEFDDASHSFRPENVHWRRLASAVSNWFS